VARGNDNAETQKAGDEENQEKIWRIVAFDRKNPPFAKSAKDGAPPSSFVG